MEQMHSSRVAKEADAASTTLREAAAFALGEKGGYCKPGSRRAETNLLKLLSAQSQENRGKQAHLARAKLHYASKLCVWPRAWAQCQEAIVEQEKLQCHDVL